MHALYLDNITRKAFEIRWLRGSIDENFSRKTSRILPGCKYIQKPDRWREKLHLRMITLHYHSSDPIFLEETVRKDTPEAC